MNDLKKSWAAKSCALGFIVLILIGNFWIVSTITHGSIPEFVKILFVIAVLWELISAAFLGCLAIYHKFFIPRS